MSDVNNGDDDELTREASLAKIKAEANLAAGYDVAAIVASAPPPPAKKFKSAQEEEAKRRARLESNRKAARESRRRKKVLVEELQRSVIFFTRANAQLRQKNDSLTNMLLTARSQIVDKNNNEALKTCDSSSSAGASSCTPGGEQPRPPATTSLTTAPASGDADAAILGCEDNKTSSKSGWGGEITKDEEPTAVASSNGNAHEMMANWLALAQAHARQAASAAAGSDDSRLAGMVPNPMLSSTTTTFPPMFNPNMTTAAALGMHPPNYSNAHRLQHSQVVPSLPPLFTATDSAAASFSV